MKISDSLRASFAFAFIAVIIFYFVPSVMAGNDEERTAQKISETWGKPSNGFRFAVFLEKTNYVVNEQILATLVLSNVDTEDHWVWEGFSPGLNCCLKIGTNNTAKFTLAKPEGKTFGGYHDISDIYVQSVRASIPMGKQIQEKLDLNYQLDPIKPGKYIVTIGRDVPVLPIPTNANAKVQYTNIFANPVEFTVIAPSNSPATNK